MATVGVKGLKRTVHSGCTETIKIRTVSPQQQIQLFLPSVKLSTYKAHSFAVSGGPSVWNSLPVA